MGGAAKHTYKTKAGLKCMEQPWFIAPSLYRPPDPFAFYALALVLTVIYLSSVSMQQTMMMMLNYIEHATAHVAPAFWPLPSRWPCVPHSSSIY